MIRIATDLPSGARAHLWISARPPVLVLAVHGAISTTPLPQPVTDPEQLGLLADALAEAALLAGPD